MSYNHQQNNGRGNERETYLTIFPESPLAPRKSSFNFAKKNQLLNETKKNVNLYPNCDIDVWLRSCEEEIVTPIEGKTTGTIPSWLRGSLLRNGPGSMKAGKDTFAHLFDSSALLHKFNIGEGRVSYQCRFVESDVYKRNWSANRIVSSEFGTKAVPDPCQTIFNRIAAIFNPKSTESDNCMISLYPFGDEIYAFTETPGIHKIDPETLESQGKVDVRKYVSIVQHSSHPHVMTDGTVYNLGLSIDGKKPKHIIVRFPPAKSDDKTMFDGASIVARVPARWPLHPSYMHTFGITENYFIIVEQPLSVSCGALVWSKLKNDPIISSLRWYQNQMTRINLVERKTGRILKFFAEALCFFHIINQYEEEEHVVLDICIYRDPSMINCMYVDNMKTMQQNPNYAKMFRSRPVRFVLPLKPEQTKSNLVTLPDTKAAARYLGNGKILVTPEKLCDLGCETPRIYYEKYLGTKYRYFYALSADIDAANPGTLIKVDTVTKTVKTWCSDNCYASEPIFVARPDAKFEDDGVILASMIWGWGDTNRTGLIILDAQTFKEVGRAEFRTPGPVPKCLHGWFLPSKFSEKEAKVQQA